MEEEGRKDQKSIWHKCFHEKDWGTTQKTLEDHERRITQSEKDTGKFYEAVNSVKLEIEGLRGDLNLTQEINGKQDKDIEGINEKEREKIRTKAAAKGQRKGTIYGAIVGAIAGGIITFIFLVVFELLKNSPYL